MVEKAGFTVEKKVVSTIPLPLLLPGLPKPVLGAMSTVLSAATGVLPGLMGYQILLTARAR